MLALLALPTGMRVHADQVALKVGVTHPTMLAGEKVELQRRDADPFMPDFPRARAVAAGGYSARVALMRADRHPETQDVVAEHRLGQGDVRQMAAAPIGVVRHQHIARRHLLT